MIKKNMIFIIMIAPSLLYFFIFNYIPMSGLILAFKKYNHLGGIFKSPWIGLANFKFLFIKIIIFKIKQF